MMSRAGKSTISQYLVFNNAAGNRKDFEIGGAIAEEDDFELMMGENKKVDLAKEMQAITDAQKYGARGQGKS